MSIDLKALERRISNLEDQQKVRELLLRYAHLLDTQRTQLVAQEIFAAEAVLDFGTGRLEGRDAIHAFYMGFSGAMLGTSHNLTNIQIEVDGDRARSLCRAMAWHWFHPADPTGALGPSDLLAVGGYQDELQRESAGWRICHRRSVQFGTGIGVGTPSDAIRPIFEGLMGRLPTWPS
jgi:hypothetical protein